MSRRSWSSAIVLGLILAGPAAAVSPQPVAAGDRHHHGWHRGHHWHHGYRWHGHRHHWRGHHWHGRHWRRHHHSDFSALFLFDLTPPPRYVYVPPPPPVYVQPPPVVRYAAPQPAYCREYTTTVYVNGRPAQTYGTACLQPDGTWRIVSMN